MAVVQCIQLWILIRSSCCYLKAKDRTKDSLDLQDQGQEQELDNVQRWAKQNNLQLNCSKSTEIVFRDSRRRLTVAEPAALPGIARISCMKMLGVSIGNDLSVSNMFSGL